MPRWYDNAREAPASAVVPVTVRRMACPAGHVWTLADESVRRANGKPRCWAPACDGAVLTGVSASTLARRQLATRLDDALAAGDCAPIHHPTADTRSALTA